jgi:PAS domain S-box-containing protein
VSRPDTAKTARSPDGPLLQALWQSPYPAALQDGGFRLVDVNEAFAAFAGRPRAALIGTDPLDLQPQADRDANRAQRDSLPQLGAPSCEVEPMRHRLVDGSGQEKWFNLSLRRVHDEGGRPLWLSVLQDMTAEVDARDEGRRAQDELALWFELCGTGMLVFDETGAVVRTNPAFEALAGRALMTLEEADPALQALLGWPPERGWPCWRTAAPKTNATWRARDRVLMDTASIGVATFDPARGWLARLAARPRRPAAAARSAPPAARAAGHRPRPRRARVAARVRAPAAALRGRAHRGALRRAPPRAGPRWLLTRVEPGALAGGRSPPRW